MVAPPRRGVPRGIPPLNGAGTGGRGRRAPRGRGVAPPLVGAGVVPRPTGPRSPGVADPLGRGPDVANPEGTNGGVASGVASPTGLKVASPTGLKGGVHWGA